MNKVDLSTYFERIQWGGATSPTLETLSGILAGHIRHIPFENLDPLLHRPVRLDIESLQQKLVQEKRGGYCFEHVTLFKAVLESLGFQTVAHTARVVLVLQRTEAARSHMFLKVPIGGQTYIADPGLGGPAPLFPVPLVSRKAEESEGLTHWFEQDPPFWTMKIRRGEEVQDAWVSTFDADNPIDFVVGNYFVATHPESAFTNRLMLRAYTNDGMVAVMNQDVTHTVNGERTKGKLESRSELRSLLAEFFGIDMPEVETMVVPAVPSWR